MLGDSSILPVAGVKGGGGGTGASGCSGGGGGTGLKPQGTISHQKQWRVDQKKYVEILL